MMDGDTQRGRSGSCFCKAPYPNANPSILTFVKFRSIFVGQNLEPALLDEFQLTHTTTLGSAPLGFLFKAASL